GSHQEQKKAEGSAGGEMNQPPSEEESDQDDHPPGKPSHDEFHIIQEGQGHHFDRNEKTGQRGGQKTVQDLYVSTDIHGNIRNLIHHDCAPGQASTSPLFSK